jgi:hypothetical protein
MKISDNNFDTKCLNYSDLSLDNDHHLKLISSLLLNSQDALDVKDTKTLGLYLLKYLNKKIVLDYYFWQRSYGLYNIGEEEIKNVLGEIKNKFNS